MSLLLSVILILIFSVLILTYLIKYVRDDGDRKESRLVEEILDLAQSYKKQTGGLMSLDKIRWELRKKHSYSAIKSQIKNVRPTGEKPSDWQGKKLGEQVCEYCREFIAQLQCPLCGRWVCGDCFYSRPLDHCKFCRPTVEQNFLEISSFTISEAMDELLTRYRGKFVWELESETPIYSFIPRQITHDEGRVLDKASSLDGRLTREDLMKPPLNWDLERAERVLGELVKKGITRKTIVGDAHIWELPRLIINSKNHES